jgi:hypothetical protein
VNCSPGSPGRTKIRLLRTSTSPSPHPRQVTQDAKENAHVPAVMIGWSSVQGLLPLRPEVVVMARGGQGAEPGPGMPGVPARPPGWRRRGWRPPRTARTARSRRPATRRPHQASPVRSLPWRAAAASSAYWSLVFCRPGKVHPGRNRSRSPSKGSGSARLALHQFSARPGSCLPVQLSGSCGCNKPGRLGALQGGDPRPVPGTSRPAPRCRGSLLPGCAAPWRHGMRGTSELR